MAKYDHGGGCACGLQKHCDCEHATVESLQHHIPEPALSPDGNTYWCHQCTRMWKPGEDPGCDRCRKIWDRIDQLKLKEGLARQPINRPSVRYDQNGELVPYITNPCSEIPLSNITNPVCANCGNKMRTLGSLCCSLSCDEAYTDQLRRQAETFAEDDLDIDQELGNKPLID